MDVVSTVPQIEGAKLEQIMNNTMQVDNTTACGAVMITCPIATQKKSVPTYLVILNLSLSPALFSISGSFNGGLFS